MAQHPAKALFDAEQAFPVIPTCEHFAGSEKLIGKALALQNTLGPIFDITMDCEDGAAAGSEKAHAEMIVAMLGSKANLHNMAGVRIHDHSHMSWQQDVDIIIGGAGEHVAYVTIPKPTAADQVAEMITYIQDVANEAKVERAIPIHVLIETHGALRECYQIAALPWVQVLDFGLMDFVSAHQGAIPGSAMRSPGQFEHPLLVRAKAEVASAALSHGVVPAHNVTLDLRNKYQTFEDARRANQEFGFQRMWSIYPAQIEPIVAAMAPNFSEVQAGCEILSAAYKADWGPIQHNGDLHDRATYRYYWRLIQRAHLAGQPLPHEIADWCSK